MKPLIRFIILLAALLNGLALAAFVVATFKYGQEIAAPYWFMTLFNLALLIGGLFYKDEDSE